MCSVSRRIGRRAPRAAPDEKRVSAAYAGLVKRPRAGSGWLLPAVLAILVIAVVAGAILR